MIRHGIDIHIRKSNPILPHLELVLLGLHCGGIERRGSAPDMTEITVWGPWVDDDKDGYWSEWFKSLGELCLRLELMTISRMSDMKHSKLLTCPECGVAVDIPDMTVGSDIVSTCSNGHRFLLCKSVELS